MTITPGGHRDDDTSRRVLENLAHLGEYFTISPVPTTAHGQWLPADSFATLSTAATVETLVDRTQQAIAGSMGIRPHEVSRRVAASSFHLSVVARLLSPLIGAALCYRMIPVLSPDNVFYAVNGHSLTLHASSPDMRYAPTPHSAAQEISAVLDGLLATLHTQLSASAKLSSRVSLGNVASAANGAVTVLAMTHPEREPAGRALVEGLLSQAPLAGCGDMRAGTFSRRSCCLFYQLPGGGLCGDCVLHARHSV